ncbi:ShlB/FhaC/HecB family hemolysin secretion/activation protein [Synechocystis sp. PCC 7509]|uniref:ShlB/FhaC/HecB family hemolysin secretion/activation protein n=1 Tax=Synechocystis sp. PCC 7509 TaxID=927677 RepID=UPI0002AC7426|nr:ShlB/FhaC/HecB family hemolysin secretion/activation protein [Synechocystis sp. PCC 7509]
MAPKQVVSCFSSVWWQLSLIVLSSATPLKAQDLELESHLNNSYCLSAACSASEKSKNLETAQLSAPQDLLPSSEPTPELLPTPAPLPPPEELLQIPLIPTTPEPIPGEAPSTITVKRFEVEGSTVFSAAEFAQVLAPYTNRPISFAEVFNARAAVTQLYLERGYITSGALIPPQTLQDGVVKIQVVEGSLEAINITGTKRLSPNYIRNRIAIGAGQPLNQQQLLAALQLLQLNPLIQNLVAELETGSRSGTSILEVNVVEAQPFHISIVADNARSPSVGSFRRQIQVNDANFLGLGDSLSLAYSNTDGSNSLDASYRLPLNPRDGTLSFSYGTSASKIIESPFNLLDINASSRYYELTLRQPIIQTPSQEFALGLTTARRESDALFLEGVQIPFPSSGADERGRTRVSVAQFFQDWTARNNNEIIAARSQFSLGIGALNSTINQNQPDSRFFSWRGQGQWVKLLARDTLLLVRADVQLADRPLVPLEQFGLGGIKNVRGYRQDALLTDNGAFTSVELHLPIYRLRRQKLLLQLVPFVDIGTTWNNSSTVETGNTSQSNTLASLGLGLRCQWGDDFTARLDWGIPVVEISSGDKTWQENGLYFSVNYNPF